MRTNKKMYHFDFNERIEGSVATEFSAIAESKERAIELFKENTDNNIENYDVDLIHEAKNQLGRYYDEIFYID